MPLIPIQKRLEGVSAHRTEPCARKSQTKALETLTEATFKSSNMTMTPNQRKYRQKKAKCKNDDRRVIAPAGFTLYLINPSNIWVRVSKAAYSRLIELSEYWGLSKAETLNRVLIKGIPKYSRIGDKGRHH